MPAAKSRMRCIPSQMVLTPGSPSPVRARKHPAWQPGAPQLRVFSEVAKHLSFSKAAQALHLTPPVITMQVKKKPGEKARGQGKSPRSGLEFILFQCEKLRQEQIYRPRFHPFPRIKSASSPGKSCAGSYEISSNTRTHTSQQG